MAVSIEQAADVLGELITVLNNDNSEIKKLEESGERWQKLREIHNQMQMIVKEDIKGLIAVHTEEEEKVRSLHASCEQGEELEAMKKELAKGKKRLEAAQAEKEQVLQTVQQKSKEQEKVSEERAQVKEKTTQDLPKLRYHVNLYNNISKIRWQYDCQPDEIKGYICNKSGVKPLSLNSQQNSKFFTVNYLWDLMEEDW